MACDGIGAGPPDEASAGSSVPDLLTARVVGVADGDTIRVRLGGAVERVRVIGLDTPEVDEANRIPACYGAEATAFAVATLGARTVTLETDPTQDERDRFGRLLAHVLVGDRLYAAAAIEGGYGIHYVYDEPSRHAAELQAAEDAARREGAGLWSACDGRVDLPLASP